MQILFINQLNILKGKRSMLKYNIETNIQCLNKFNIYAAVYWIIIDSPSYVECTHSISTGYCDIRRVTQVEKIIRRNSRSLAVRVMYSINYRESKVSIRNRSTACSHVPASVEQRFDKLLMDRSPDCLLRGELA